MKTWEQKIARMRASTDNPVHIKWIDQLELARKQYMETRDDRVLLQVAVEIRPLLGQYIMPLSVDERKRLIAIGLIDVPEVSTQTTP